MKSIILYLITQSLLITNELQLIENYYGRLKCEREEMAREHAFKLVWSTSGVFIRKSEGDKIIKFVSI